MMKIAQGKDLAGLICSEAAYIPFRDSCFDASFLSHVMHLVDDWEGLGIDVTGHAKGFLISPLTPTDGLRIRDEYDRFNKERVTNRRLERC
jgi:hypothetical protein